MSIVAEKHPHYHKDVKGLETIDVYRVLQLFNVTDPCLQHAIKKLLVAGGRGAGKGPERDIQEAIDCLTRSLEIINEDYNKYASAGAPSLTPIKWAFGDPDRRSHFDRRGRHED